MKIFLVHIIFNLHLLETEMDPSNFSTPIFEISIFTYCGESRLALISVVRITQQRTLDLDEHKEQERANVWRNIG